MAMNKATAVKLLNSGAITQTEFDAIFGENFENAQGNSPHGPELASSSENAQKNNAETAEETERRKQKMEQMGLGGGYRQPSVAELATADSLRVKKEPGYKCPVEGRNVLTCPAGNIYSCSRHAQCNFASVVIAKTEGNRSIGNLVLSPNGANEPAISDEGDLNVGAPAQAAGVPAAGARRSIEEQAVSLLKMRRQASQRRA